MQSIWFNKTEFSIENDNTYGNRTYVDNEEQHRQLGVKLSRK